MEGIIGPAGVPGQTGYPRVEDLIEIRLATPEETRAKLAEIHKKNLQIALIVPGIGIATCLVGLALLFAFG